MSRANNQKNNNQQEEDDDRFHVIVTKAPIDPTTEHVYCPMCRRSRMKWLPGFPVGHAQWLCESCGVTAYEGYGDTPSKDSSLRALATPNNPYATAENISRPYVKDIPTDLDNNDEPQVRGERGRIDLTTKDKKRRYGMRYAFTTAEEATKAI